MPVLLHQRNSKLHLLVLDENYEILVELKLWSFTYCMAGSGDRTREILTPQSELLHLKHPSHENMKSHPG